MKSATATLMLVLAITTTACHKKTGDPAANAEMAVANETAADKAPDSVPPSDQTANTVAPATKFDMASVPVSAVALGSFPYFSLPEGYEAGNAKTLDIAKVPYWVGDHFEWVEGKIFQSSIDVKSGKDFSSYEVKRNIAALIQQAGGKQIFEGRIPGDAISKLPEDAKQSFSTGLGGMYSDPAIIYLIHRTDKDIWIHLTVNTGSGSWAITESRPFAQTAKLLPATAP